jgi:DNA-binding CsgD family transcriptional regulator
VDSAGEFIAVVGAQVAFRRPLVRSVAYHESQLADRRDVHAALAHVTTDYERLWHRVHSCIGTDNSLAADLEHAADQAFGRGALGVAADAYFYAANVSVAPEARAGRLIQSARAAHLVGRHIRARALLELAERADIDGSHRYAIAHMHGRILLLTGHDNEAFDVLRNTSNQCRGHDPDLAATLLAEACIDCISSADIPLALITAREAAQIASRASPGPRLFSTTMLACATALSGDRQEALRILRPMLADLHHVDPLSQAGALVTAAGHCCTWLELYDDAEALLTRHIRATRNALPPGVLAWPLTCYADLQVRRGSWNLAQMAASEAAALATDLGQWVIVTYAQSWLAWHAAALGDEAKCRRLVAATSDLVERHHIQPGRAYLGTILGLLELGLGRPAQAVMHLEMVRDLVARNGLGEANVVRWPADLVESYLRAGRWTEASVTLGTFAARADDAGPWVQGAVARCRGLLAADLQFDDFFGASAECFASIPSAFDEARTRLCWGEQLRRASRRTEARRQLYAARQTFADLRASGWTARAETELRATGDHVRHTSPHGEPTLTPQEMHVVVAVAGGASNKEAAATLFLSTRTVEFHLTNVYRKLGVRSRIALATLAIRRGWANPPQPLPRT